MVKYYPGLTAARGITIYPPWGSHGLPLLVGPVGQHPRLIKDSGVL